MGNHCRRHINLLVGKAAVLAPERELNRKAAPPGQAAPPHGAALVSNGAGTGEPQSLLHSL